MKTIQRVLHLDRHDYYIKHLNIVSTLLPTNLTEKEIEVLAAFMSLDDSIIEEDMFNSFARRKVMDKVKLSAASLSNYIRSISDKKILYKEDNKIKVRDFLLPKSDIQGYQIKIINKDEI